VSDTVTDDRNYASTLRLLRSLITTPRHKMCRNAKDLMSKYQNNSRPRKTRIVQAVAAALLFSHINHDRNESLVDQSTNRGAPLH